MPGSSLILILLSTAVSLSLLAATGKLRQTRRVWFLGSYRAFLSTTIVYGLLNWVGVDLTTQILRDRISPWELLDILAILATLALPVLLAKLYFYLQTLESFLHQDLSRGLRAGYLLAAAVSYGIYLVVLKRYFDSGETNPLFSTSRVIGVAAVAIQYLAILSFLVRVKNLPSPSEARLGTRFGWSYAGGLLLYVSVAWLAQQIPHSGLGTVTACLYFLMHIPPLGFLLTHDGKAVGADFGVTPQFKERYQITDREAEIIDLTVRGFQNKEIAKQLFLSTHTVRNHLYNVYRKTGVGTKVQLANLVRASEADEID